MTTSKAKYSLSTITVRVADILVENLGVDADDITPDALLRDDLSADSLDVVELAMAFEEEFGIEINDEQADKMVRVQDIIDFLARKLGAK
jgi:acyl carrier protein